jgi:hypothetical protein
MKKQNKRNKIIKVERRQEKQFLLLVLTGLYMAIGLIFLKLIPMWIFGKNIVFDASMHIVVSTFILYVIWFFIDQNKSWRIPFFIFSVLVLAIIAIQRILVNAHDDIGILLGLVVAVISILIANWRKMKGEIEF